MSKTKEALRRSMSAYKGSVTKQMHNCQTLQADSNTSHAEFQASLSTLQRRFNSYEESYHRYLEAVIESESEGSALEKAVTDAFEVFEDDFQIALRQFHVKLRQLSTTSQQPSPVTVYQSNPVTQFEKLKLPKFNGDLMEWPNFWSRFNKLVVQNQQFSDTERSMFLEQCLVSPAIDVVKGLLGANADFNQIIQLLKDRYADEELLKETLVLRFVDMVPALYNIQSLTDFRSQYHNIMGALSPKLNDERGGDHFLIPLLLRKLPTQIRDQLTVSHKKNHFTVDEILTGLDSAIKTLSIVPNLNSQTPRKQNTQSVRTKDPIPNHGTVITTKTNLPKTSKLKSGRAVVSQGVTKKAFVCLYCGEAHNSTNCPSHATLQVRKDRLGQLNRCKRCVSLKHKTDDCTTQLTTCKVCQTDTHHTALCCKGQNNPSELASEPASADRKTSGAVTAQPEKIEHRSVALPTATMRFINQNKERFVSKVFFDQGSQCTIMSTKLARNLKLELKEKTKLAVSGVLTDQDYTEYPIARVTVQLGRRTKTIFAVVMDRAVATIRVPGLQETAHKLIQAGVHLADDDITSDTIQAVGLTIGSDYYGDFVSDLTVKYGINLCKTPGGYMIYGPMHPIKSHSFQHVGLHRLTTNLAPLDRIDGDQEGTAIHKLWDLDAVGINPDKPLPEDNLTYDQYLQTVTYGEGQYWVRLPWRHDARDLPTNYNMAYGQVKHLRENLLKRGDLQIYDDLIRSQEECGFIEKVDSSSPQVNTHYLPHHAVAKDSATTPLRIVFNCSAKSGHGPSLNDCLMAGPNITNNLVDVLLKFRTCKYAFSADISKAFLRIGLQACDRDFTRFLWFENPFDPKSSIVVYRFKSVLFGATSSPFLLQATLDYHLNNSTCDMANFIRESFYVDNLQGTHENEEFLDRLYTASNEEMAKANMPLRQWVSNSDQLNKKFLQDFLDYEVPSVTNILGLTWNPGEDTLSIKAGCWNDSPNLTKRELLSRVSSTFDPLGLISPLTIRGKMLVKAAWKLKLGWDDPLPEEFSADWTGLVCDLVQVNSLKFPRTVVCQDINYQLHIFCDASVHAFGAVAYAVIEGSSQLITSKARVTPVKTRTLPELELTAIQIGVKLANYIARTLTKINFNQIHVWSDNEAALQWIRNDHCTKPYVKNRVAEIRESSGNYIFYHVGTKDNPADLISRGTTLKDLTNNSLWFNGPSWLITQDEWPEQKPHVIVQAVLLTPEEPLFDVTRFHKLRKLLRVAQIVFNYCKIKVPQFTLPSVMEYLILEDQRLHFVNERKLLMNQPLPDDVKPALVNSLGLFIDPDSGLLRCRGRVQNTNASIALEPILLPRKSHLTKLIVEYYHAKSHHGGMGETLATLRERYWIPKGRQVVKNIISHCYVCKFLFGRPFKYPGPPVLPNYRVSHSKPFNTVGVDYSGPIMLYNDTGEADKYYVCLFTCTTSRAVHLELAPDMTAQTFLQLLRRFIARYSCPRTIISDNGTNLRATASLIEKIFTDPEVRDFLQEHATDWKFIPPRSPWQGGFYERLIGITKTSLKKALFRKRVSEEELRTILCEIEQRINNRPLTYIADDVDSPTPLTPSHLIYGRRLEMFPALTDLNDDDPDYLDHNALFDRYCQVNTIIRKWEEVWGKEYIASLREKFYGAQPPRQKTAPAIGEIVLVIGEGPRLNWPLGRIMDLLPDSTGTVRLVSVMVRGRVVLKTLEKIIPLEVGPSEADDPTETNRIVNHEPDSVSMEENSPDTEIVEESVDAPVRRPFRRAAQQAEKMRRDLISQDLL